MGHNKFILFVVQFNKKVIDADTVNFPRIMHCSEETQAYVASKKKSKEVQVTRFITT